MENINNPTIRRLKLQDAINVFIKTFYPSIWRENTRKNYLATFKLLKNHLGGNKFMRSISFDDITTFCNLETYTKKNPETKIKYMSHLNHFFNWLIENEYMDINPLKRTKKPKTNTTLKPFLTIEQIQCLMKYLPYPYGEIIYIYLKTGCRAGELIKNGNSEYCYPLFESQTNCLILKNTKTRKDRRIPIAINHDGKLITIIKKYLNDKNELVFPKHITYLKLWQTVRETFDAMGLHRDYDLKALRRTFGSWLQMSCHDLMIVKDALGHSNINTTAKYYAGVDKEEIRTAIDKMPF